MKKWEYKKVERRDISYTIGLVEDLGLDGWEMCAYDGIDCVFYFKREIIST